MYHRLGITTSVPLLSQRIPLTYVEFCKVVVKDSALTLLFKDGPQPLPALQFACILLGPGTSITHDAIKLLADAETTVCWVGTQGFRYYAYGRSNQSNVNSLRWQATLVSNQRKREQVARRMFALRFGQATPPKATIEQLRGMEGVRVRNSYLELAKQYGVAWDGRNYDPTDWNKADLPNKLLCQANAALYCVTQAVVLSLGFSPDLGFIHTGIARAFTLDIADLYKAESTFKLAFSLSAQLQAGGEISLYSSLREQLTAIDIVNRMVHDIKDLLGEPPTYTTNPTPVSCGMA